VERETGFEPATFCLGSPDLGSVVASTWMGQRIAVSYGVVERRSTRVLRDGGRKRSDMPYAAVEGLNIYRLARAELASVGRRP